MKNSLALSMARVFTIKLHQIIGIYSKVDAFVAPSRRMASALEEFGIDRKKIHYIPSFVNLQNYEPCYENRGYALYFGRLSAEKGVNILLEAWEQLREKAPELNIVGSGDELDRLLKMKKQLNLDSVNFHDFTTNKEELIGLIQNSAFVLIPSLWEDNSPMAAYEAMALGKPIIASGLGGLLDQIENNKSGYLVKHGDASAFANAVLMLQDDKEKIKTFGKAARERMEQLFNSSAHVKLLQTIFG
jgi:glycosyltransferase involved in cell wall biosynthesis